VRSVECYILQWLAASSTSHSQVLHDESGTHSEVPLKIETGIVVCLQVGVRDFSFLQSVHSSFAAHLTAYPILCLSHEESGGMWLEGYMAEKFHVLICWLITLCYIGVSTCVSEEHTVILHDCISRSCNWYSLIVWLYLEPFISWDIQLDLLTFDFSSSWG
jgi:hypothetical protein